MKNKKIVTAIITVMVIVYSCNKEKLNQPPLGLLNESNLATKQGVEGLLIGAYSLLDGFSYDEQGTVGFWGSAASNWIYGSICGSEANKGSRPDDQPAIIEIETFNPGATNFYFDAKWAAVYAGVARANGVLRVMRKAKNMTAADTTEVSAEARFLRAFYHFEAKKMWNNIPYVDETVTYDAGNYYISNDTSWAPIENDLKYAVENLLPTQPAAGRANKYAAKAFLAKAYMFQLNYAAAKPLLMDLINNGVTAGGKPYELSKNFGDNFNPEFKNSGESVFSVQSSVNDGADGNNGNTGDVLNFPYGGGPGICCGFSQPSQWLVNHFRTDAHGLPDLDNFNTSDVKNDQAYDADSSFTPDTGSLDPRLDWTVGRRGVPYLDWGPHPGKPWTRDPFYRMGPYGPKKNTYSESQYGHFTDPGYWSAGAVANNVNLIRYADILLWAAEVEAETGEPDKARDYVNKVRERAANPSSWVKNEDNIRYAKAVTNSKAEFDVIDDPSFKDIRPIVDWVVRKDLNETWVAIKVNADGTKVWNAYPVPNYKIDLYKNVWTKDFARKAIRYERVLELGMEGHRFFDLVRWGVAKQEIDAYLKTEKWPYYLNNASFTPNKNEYFPIPQHQIDLSAGADGKPKMKQNPGY